ncbi:GNAT family N-acetyltransferase [Paenibacillus contaminans]|uniref:GNAT family N-acetyltransferase n=1 Tax=Paenibacillus contaminans TaxID=450362 RepID=A0A329M0X3_9BACL|nr:GNAT family N-acetyltransferase [Paenibacillus contaminans]RAV13815.1 GNAT family N-acetyltransferase [Paenibacillus contaminans]
MKVEIKENTMSFYNLEWDTAFFGVTCAKAILHKPLTMEEWIELKAKFKEYQFVSIENRNSEPSNAQLIGKETSAFLADVNIQFIKKIEEVYNVPHKISIHCELEKNDQIMQMADFQFSKFTEDPELEKRGGAQVYRQWLLNSFDKPNKYYVLSKDESNNINGYLLHSYSDNVCVIELIAVSQSATKSGIGAKLFSALEHSAFQRGVKAIKVGTQLRNMGAINFYQKVGCKQAGCHQVYHLWNLDKLSEK